MRGQAFTVFKLLIAAVFAVTLLLIVYNVVSNIPAAPVTGAEVIRDLSIEAHNAPGLCFQREHAPFQKDDEFTAEYFQHFLNVSFYCDVDPDYSSVFEYRGDECHYRIKEVADVPVKIVCDLVSCDVMIGESC